MNHYGIVGNTAEMWYRIVGEYLMEVTLVELKNEFDILSLNRLRSLSGCNGVQLCTNPKNKALALGGYWSAEEIAGALQMTTEDIEIGYY